MAHVLRDLPYAKNGLAPHISEETLNFHYGKHHQTYVNKLNELVDGTELAGKTLDETVQAVAGKADKLAIFNNAAQVWNHDFYWDCMKPGGGGSPSTALEAKINAAFGSMDAFKAEFKAAAIGQFGSGWAWLAEKDGGLVIMKTANADLPMMQGAKALMTCDVWEHAYYLDYQNRRPDYVDTFLTSLVNWEFVESNLA